MTELPKLPEPPAPDTHCWDDDTRLDVWSHSAYQLNQYGAECRRQALEEAAKVCENHPDGLNMLGGDFVTCAAAIRGML